MTTLPFSITLSFCIPCLVMNLSPWLQITTTCEAFFTNSLCLLDIIILIILHPKQRLSARGRLVLLWLREQGKYLCGRAEFKVRRQGRCFDTEIKHLTQNFFTWVWVTWADMGWSVDGEIQDGAVDQIVILTLYINLWNNKRDHLKGKCNVETCIQNVALRNCCLILYLELNKQNRTFLLISVIIKKESTQCSGEWMMFIFWLFHKRTESE